MSKYEIITQIRRQNRSAAVAFLDSFDEKTLTTYLKRLALTRGLRDRSSVWVRQGRTPAVVTRLH